MGVEELFMGYLGLLPYFWCSILLIIYQTWQLWVSIDFSTSVLYCLLLKTAFELNCKYNFFYEEVWFIYLFLKFLMRTLRNYLSQGNSHLVLLMGSICNCTEISILIFKFLYKNTDTWVEHAADWTVLKVNLWRWEQRVI